MTLKSVCAGVAVAALLALAAPVAAQAPSGGAEAQAAYDAAFQAMLADPASLEKTFKYAELSVQVGNFEGAIAALERMLLINPNLPRVRLELGVLYFRLGSFETARGYFQSAQSAPDVPASVRTKVTEYLAAIEAQQSPHSLTGSLTVGVRYQSNANSGTNKPDSVRFPGFAGVDSFLSLPSSDRRRSDFNGVSILQTNYRYDMGNQDGDAIEATALAYGTQALKVTDLNLGLFEGTVGPRLFFPEVAPGFNVRPYVLGNYLLLGGSPYIRSLGGGASLTLPIDNATQLNFSYEVRNKAYYVNAAQPLQKERNSNDNSIIGGIRYQLHETGFIGLDLSYRFELASRRYYSNRELGATLSYTHLLDDYLGLTGQPWTLQFSAGRSYTTYGEPDPSVSNDITRRDSKWDLSALLVVPVTDWASFQFQVQQLFATSTYEQNRYGNLSSLVALQMRF